MSRSSRKLVSLLSTVPIAAAVGVLRTRTPAASLSAGKGVDAAVEGTLRSLPEACSHFPATPFYRHGKFEDKNFSNNFSFSGEDLLTLEAHGLDSLLPFLHKLAAGASVRISVLGGSFTAGVLCRQGVFDGKMCSWPARFLEWLRLTFPDAEVQLENLGHGGSTSAVILAGIGITLTTDPQGRPPDLIILDTLVNDAYEAKWHYTVGKGVKRNYSELDIVSISYEKLVRTLQELYPAASLLSVLAGCIPACVRAEPVQVKVNDYYSVPWVDFASLTAQKPSLWQPAEVHPAHPTWRTHQVFADVITYMLGKTWHEFCSQGAPESGLRPVPRSSRHPPLYERLQPGSAAEPVMEDVGRPSCCRAKFEGLQEPIVTKGNWTLYEDRPGKPGWISTTPGSWLQFPLRFGKVARLTIEYLRSYEGMGSVKLHINGKKAVLNGLWKAGHENVSQSYVVNFAANELSVQDSWKGDYLDADEGNSGFGIKPMGTATLDVEVLPSNQSLHKFKIINVLSC